MNNGYFVLYSFCSHWKYRQPVDNCTTLVFLQNGNDVIYPFLLFAGTSVAIELLYLMALKKVG